MAPSAVIHIPSSCATRHLKTHQPFFSPAICTSKAVSFTVRASTSLDNYAPSTPAAPLNRSASSWKWKYRGNSVNIHFEKFEKEGSNGPRKNILMVPTISDVSTVEEWRLVAEEIVRKNGGTDLSATIVDWPGLGYSERPKLDYNADVMERFLVDFISSPDCPIASSVAGVKQWYLQADFLFAFVGFVCARSRMSVFSYQLVYHGLKLHTCICPILFVLENYID